MKCEDVLDRLDDHLEGSLPGAEAREVERHVRECPDCAQEERALRSLLAEAAALPSEREPQRDLWPEIAERIRGGKVVPFGGSRLRSLANQPLMLAAAAAILVALSSAVTTLVVRGRQPGAATASGTTPPSAEPGEMRAPGAMSASWASYEGAETEYVRAAESLEAAIRSRQSALSPETVAVVQNNLRVIDEALDQVRAALRKDPGNRELVRMLVATHQRKVAVLRRVAKLAT